MCGLMGELNDSIEFGIAMWRVIRIIIIIMC